jgi:hypothetical protein
VVRRAHTCEQRSKACSPPFPLEQDKIRENVCVTEGKQVAGARCFRSDP